MQTARSCFLASVPQFCRVRPDTAPCSVATVATTMLMYVQLSQLLFLEREDPERSLPAGAHPLFVGPEVTCSPSSLSNITRKKAFVSFLFFFCHL